MKSFKKIAVGAIACSLASLALADVTGNPVNIVGATAFRTSAVQAEIALLSHVGANLPGGVAETNSVGASVTGATYSSVHGYLADGTTEVVFRNHWTGSAAGCYDLSAGNAVGFLSLTGNTVGTTNVNLSTPVYDATAVPNATFTDVQAADAAASLATAVGGATYASAINGGGLTNAGTASTKSTGVAIATFQWVLGKNALGTQPIAGITQQNAATLFTNGYLSLSAVTGNSGDESSYLVLVGRNEDSGSRILGEAESLAAGVAKNSGALGAAINQFMLRQDSIAYPTNPNTTSGYPTIAAGTVITGFQLWPKTITGTTLGWPVSTVTGLTWKVTGHSGYNGGGDVAAILKTSNPVVVNATNFPNGFPGNFTSGNSVYFISYLGTSDVGGVVTAGGLALTYNGVGFTSSAVAEGQYTLFSFEHLYYKSTLTGVAVTALDGLADSLISIPSTGSVGAAGLPISTVTGHTGASRSQSAGGLVY
jgi:hypothetical protein